MTHVIDHTIDPWSDIETGKRVPTQNAPVLNDQADTAAARGASDCVCFGPFRLSKMDNNLTENGVPVRVGSRAIEILALLVSRAGESVDKREIMEAVWPDTHVVEGNLTVHIAALRRALKDGLDGQQYILNVPGRGYRFVAKLTWGDGNAELSMGPSSGYRKSNVPLLLTRPVGREASLAELCNQVGSRRLITIVGAAGLGKTNLAIQLAGQVSTALSDAVWLIDVSALAGPSELVPALIATLTDSLEPGAPIEALETMIKGRSALLVFDNCEHMIDSVADLIMRLLRETHELKIVTTSREPLLLQGEYVYRLEPLSYPAEGSDPNPVEALQFPAVRLFLEKIAEAVGSFEPTAENVRAIAAICRRLDGIPLAIEFAAARVEAFGVAGVARRLGNRLHTLSSSHRLIAARHRTLAAALEWSYQLLSPIEQTLLCRLGIFTGWFSFESVLALGQTGDRKDYDEQLQIEAVLTGLVHKSMVHVDCVDSTVHYRLLQPTRIFLLEKLAEAGELRNIARRHAAYCLRRVRESAAGAVPLPPDVLVNGISNVRTALGWTFSDDGDHALGVELFAVAAPRLIDLGFADECMTWLSSAVGATEEPVTGSAVPEFTPALMSSQSFAAALLGGTVAMSEDC